MANTIETYVDYIQNQLPGLKSGDYSVNVKQTFSAKGVPANTEFDSNEFDFSIQGDRFNLRPTDVLSVYPPANSLGEHSSVFPQIVFVRNTLPWERLLTLQKPGSDDTEKKKIEQFPWLALLVFNEGELSSTDEKASLTVVEQGESMRLDAFRKLMGGAYPKKEKEQKDDDKLRVIYVPKDKLSVQMLSASALTQLSHARESALKLNLSDAPNEDSIYYEIWDAEKQLVHADHLSVVKGKTGQQINLNPGPLKAGEYSVKVFNAGVAVNVMPKKIKVSANDDFGHKVGIVAANRLPTPGAKSIVHLVSLEERYKWDGKQYSFDYDLGAQGDLIPLISLKTWSFNCVTEAHNFDQLLAQIAQEEKDNPSKTLRQPTLPNPHGDANIDTANGYLQNGYKMLPHFFRRGGKSMSWYRGPLMPGKKKTSSLPAGILPASCSDELLAYDQTYGVFDVSYASAWELGRVLALRNKSVSTKLFNWKRLHQNQIKIAEQQEGFTHLPFQPKQDGIIPLPNEVENWYSALSLLKGLPFNYLVPDENMLPKESIRFFRLDQDWISCMVDGAFSIGRLTETDQAVDEKLRPGMQTKIPSPIVSGFLLRSFVVKGWPKLQVDGYKRMAATEEGMDANKLDIIRMERLSPNVLLVLFSGDIKAVDIHEKPEMLHMGFDFPKKAVDGYKKQLRKADGSVSTQPSNLEQLNDKLWNEKTRVVEIGKLFGDVKKKKSLNYAGKFTSAQFTMSMVEGVQKVRFVRKGA